METTLVPMLTSSRLKVSPEMHITDRLVAGQVASYYRGGSAAAPTDLEQVSL